MIFDISRNFGFVHVELSNVCNASCPMCMRGRMFEGEYDKHELSLRDFKKIFGDIVTKVDEFWLSGNYSDPMTNSEMYEICEWIFNSSPRTRIRINTNCSLRSSSYWAKLGTLFSKHRSTNSGIVASIDGLSDTNHLYRVGCDFKKIMSNCSSFIESGGHVFWKFIVFDHNKHQVDEAKQLSTNMGFSGFSVVTSSRFLLNQQKIIYLDKNKTLKEIKDPTNTSSIETLLEKEHSTIQCQSKKRNEIFVNEQGVIMPCCWTMGRIAEHSNIGSDAMSKSVWKRYPNLLEDLNAIKNDLIDVLNHRFWGDLELLWTVNSPNVCYSKCKKRIDDVAEYFIDGKLVGSRKM